MPHYETRQVKIYDRHDYDKVSEEMGYAGAYEYMRNVKEITVKYDGTEEDFANHCFNVAKKIAMSALIEARKENK